MVLIITTLWVALVATAAAALLPQMAILVQERQALPTLAAAVAQAVIRMLTA